MGGLTIRFVTAGLYYAAAGLFLSVNSLSLMVVIGFTIVADALALIGSNLAWGTANGDIPLSENYNETVVPKYNKNNLTDFYPNNEFEASIKSIASSSIRLMGDMEAYNETIARKKSAKLGGDYNATIKQNLALINYTEMLENDFEEFQSDLELLNYQFSKNSSEISENIYNFGEESKCYETNLLFR